MRPLSKADKSQFRRNLKASIKRRNLTRRKLIDAAHTAQNNGWPQYLWPDGNEDAWFRRKSADSEFIEKRGGFSNDVVMLAITGSNWETKETVAGWLRDELKLLRDAEASLGVAPVRRGKTLSRIEISEIAVELLECIGGEQLVCLFQELLEIDRHRKSLAENFSQLDRAAKIESISQLKGLGLGVRALAKRMSVSPSTVTRWKKSQFYLERVEFHKRIWEDFLREDYFEQIKAAAAPEATDAECFRRAFQMYAESIPQRQATPL